MFVASTEYLDPNFLEFAFLAVPAFVFRVRVFFSLIQSPCTLLYHPDDYVSNDLVGWRSSDPVLLEGVAVYSVYHLLYHYGMVFF